MIYYIFNKTNYLSKKNFEFHKWANNSTRCTVQRVIKLAFIYKRVIFPSQFIRILDTRIQKCLGEMCVRSKRSDILVVFKLKPFCKLVFPNRKSFCLIYIIYVHLPLFVEQKTDKKNWRFNIQKSSTENISLFRPIFSRDLGNYFCVGFSSQNLAYCRC